MVLAEVIMVGLIVLTSIICVTLVVLSLIWTKWGRDIVECMKDDDLFY